MDRSADQAGMYDARQCTVFELKHLQSCSYTGAADLDVQFRWY